MKRRTKRDQQRSKRRAAREAGQRAPGGAPNYARKRAFLNKHGGTALDYPKKPWRSSKS